jgi:hypothetical protein
MAHHHISSYKQWTNVASLRNYNIRITFITHVVLTFVKNLNSAQGRLGGKD